MGLELSRDELKLPVIRYEFGRSFISHVEENRIQPRTEETDFSCIRAHSRTVRMKFFYIKKRKENLKK